MASSFNNSHMLLQNDHNVCSHLMFLISCRDIQVSLINKWFAQGKEFSNWSYWILILLYLLGSKSLKIFVFENEQHTFWSWKKHLINTAVTCHVLEGFSKLEIMVVGKFCLILMGKLGCIVLYLMHAIARTHSSTHAAGLMRVCVYLYSSTVKASSVCKISQEYLRVRINGLVLWILLGCFM